MPSWAPTLQFTASRSVWSVRTTVFVRSIGPLLGALAFVSVVFVAGESPLLPHAPSAATRTPAKNVRAVARRVERDRDELIVNHDMAAEDTRGTSARRGYSSRAVNPGHVDSDEKRSTFSNMCASGAAPRKARQPSAVRTSARRGRGRPSR